ncbi:MAG: Gmad2 immunoglobulin-like domain-containing protein [Aeromicrobium sp.]
MKARGLILLLIVALAAAVAYLYLRGDGDSSKGVPTSAATTSTSTKFESKHGDEITVNAPRSGQSIASPVSVSGIVPGVWSFEANFPITVTDSNHKIVGKGYGTVSGEWMTEDPVKFTASVKFKKPSTDTGFVEIHKANPSGDESHEDSVRVPVRFGG